MNERAQVSLAWAGVFAGLLLGFAAIISTYNWLTTPDPAADARRTRTAETAQQEASGFISRTFTSLQRRVYGSRPQGPDCTVSERAITLTSIPQKFTPDPVNCHCEYQFVQPIRMWQKGASDSVWTDVKYNYATRKFEPPIPLDVERVGSTGAEFETRYRCCPTSAMAADGHCVSVTP